MTSYWDLIEPASPCILVLGLSIENIIEWWVSSATAHVASWANTCGRRNERWKQSDLTASFSDKDNKVPFLIASNSGVSEEVWRGFVLGDHGNKNGEKF